MKRSSFDNETANEMAILYGKGESLRTIGSKFNANPQTVRRQLAKVGVVVRPRGRPRRGEAKGAVTPEVTTTGPVSDNAFAYAATRVVSF